MKTLIYCLILFALACETSTKKVTDISGYKFFAEIDVIQENDSLYGWFIYANDSSEITRGHIAGDSISVYIDNYYPGSEFQFHGIILESYCIRGYYSIIGAKGYREEPFEFYKNYNCGNKAGHVVKKVNYYN